MTEELWGQWHEQLFRWTNSSQPPLSEECRRRSWSSNSAQGVKTLFSSSVSKHPMILQMLQDCSALQMNPDGNQESRWDGKRVSKKRKKRIVMEPDQMTQTLHPLLLLKTSSRYHDLPPSLSHNTPRQASLECSGSETKCNTDLETVQKFSFCFSVSVHDSSEICMSVTVKICIHWSST